MGAEEFKKMIHLDRQQKQGKSVGLSFDELRNSHVLWQPYFLRLLCVSTAALSTKPGACVIRTLVLKIVFSVQLELINESARS